ncbi:hypothetical protein GCK72_009174 [Caenorhabditis remanei]|uniref:F-box domain-containing protein n=1 Tax=Caenorhabditis remanei TaxID=31234 RepID=A0A6A5H1N1_CAERE|nr:hypothetical protein GCK72_009174 [Caenorhabditis remanei]KAF1760921.1 hypothetical protein GCK72_009174 [Caenorhabditis remanei]
MTSTSSPFPLFRLPRIVLSEVFNSTTPDEIIQISLCSKRAARVIKYTPNKWKNKNSLHLIFYGNEPSRIQYLDCPLLFVSKFSENENLEHFENVKVGNVIAKMGKRNMTIYCKNTLEVIKRVVEHSMECFNCEISSFAISHLTMSSEIQWILQWMSSRNTVFTYCWLDCNQDAIEGLNNFKNIRFNSTANGSRTNNPTTSLMAIPTEYLSIFQGSWLKKTHLNYMNCTRLTLEGTSFSCGDINEILKGWQHGELLSHLKCGRFGTTNQDLDQLLEGIMYQMFIEKKEYKMSESDVHPIYGGFNIDREDGVVGTVTNHSDGFHNMFALMVWPDWTN